MRRLGQCMLVGVFAALMLLSCRSLVSRPEAETEASLPPPIQAALRTAAEAVPAEDVIEHHLPGTASRRLLPVISGAALLPVSVPVRDGNGIPLGKRPYVRTAYAACRLEETSG
ncbi:MAG: hypothetical protein J1E43_05300 [Christensenellaceae bacterium]|nr:hypothetical protein [Christensenellaceae bacterium]